MGLSFQERIRFDAWHNYVDDRSLASGGFCFHDLGWWLSELVDVNIEITTDRREVGCSINAFAAWTTEMNCDASGFEDVGLALRC